jgi:hypothetical protein
VESFARTNKFYYYKIFKYIYPEHTQLFGFLAPPFEVDVNRYCACILPHKEETISVVTNCQQTATFGGRKLYTESPFSWLATLRYRPKTACVQVW